jgi:hypothetical protein
MKFENVTLEIDEDMTSLEEIALQLQKYTDKIIRVIDGSDMEVIDSVKPYSRYSVEDVDETEHGTIYTIKKLPTRSKDRNDEESDSDPEDTYAVFRKDVFDTLTKKPSLKEKKEKRRKHKIIENMNKQD